MDSHLNILPISPIVPRSHHCSFPRFFYIHSICSHPKFPNDCKLRQSPHFCLVQRSLLKNLESEFSESDFAFLKELSAKKDSRLNAPALLEILSAVDLVGYASSPTLPLELALIKLVGSK